MVPSPALRLLAASVVALLAVAAASAQPAEPGGRKPDPTGADRPKAEPDPADERAVPKLAPNAPPPAANDDARYEFDTDHLYLKQVEDQKPLQPDAENPSEARAYRSLVLFARDLPADGLAAHARKDVPFGLMMDASRDARDSVRYQLVRLTGRLKRLQKVPAGSQLRAAGVDELYEAWVFDDATGNPVCVHLTRKPEGVEPESEIAVARPVTAVGYYFKVIRYASAEPSKKSPDRGVVRNAPLLVGGTLLVGLAVDRDKAGNDWVYGFLPMALGVMALVGGLVVGLTWWFRRSDRGAREAAAHRRANPFEAGAQGGGRQPPEPTGHSGG